jgi:hypothetical protein
LLAAMSAWYWTVEGMLVEARQWLAAAESVTDLNDRVRAALRLGVGRIAAPLGRPGRRGRKTPRVSWRLL